MKRFALTTALVALSAPAIAGGLDPVVVTPAPVVPVAPMPMVDLGWTGFYAGGQIGAGQFDTESDDDGFDGLEGSGGLFGVHAGYLYDFGTLVLGGELDYDATSFEFDDDEDSEIDSVARLKALFGYDAGAFMPYLTAGVASASADVDGDDLSDSGSFYGLGAKYAVSDNVLIGGEYLTHQFDDFDDQDVDIDVDTLSLRVSYKF